MGEGEAGAEGLAMEDRASNRERLAALVDHGTPGEGGTWAAFDESDGINLLTQVLFEGWFDLALRLLARGYDVETFNLCGSSPLVAACGTGRTTVAAFLIGAGAGVDGADGDDLSPLCEAVRNDDFETSRLLIGAGASLNLRTYWQKLHPWVKSEAMRACLREAGWVEGE